MGNIKEKHQHKLYGINKMYKKNLQIFEIHVLQPIFYK